MKTQLTLCILEIRLKVSDKIPQHISGKTSVKIQITNYTNGNSSTDRSLASVIIISHYLFRSYGRRNLKRALSRAHYF